MCSIEKVFTFTAAVRGFHYYQKIWVPEVAEKLKCFHEVNNAFDIFAIKTVSENGITVGHLPREVSRVTKFLLDRGARISLELTSRHYRRSPLVQGGLEIACQLTVKLPGTIKNHMIMDRYKELVLNMYTEPKDEEILGSFLVSIQEPLSSSKKSSFPRKRKIAKNLPVANKKNNDIREMFKVAARTSRQEKDNIPTIIEID